MKLEGGNFVKDGEGLRQSDVKHKDLREAAGCDMGAYGIVYEGTDFT